jgi:hypothetical protein
VTASSLPRYPLHDCPGECGRQVAQSKLACPACWWRLPRNLAAVVTRTYYARLRNPTDNTRTSAHRAAVADATQWYRDNPTTIPTVHTGHTNRKAAQ